MAGAGCWWRCDLLHIRLCSAGSTPDGRADHSLSCLAAALAARHRARFGHAHWRAASCNTGGWNTAHTKPTCFSTQAGSARRYPMPPLSVGSRAAELLDQANASPLLCATVSSTAACSHGSGARVYNCGECGPTSGAAAKTQYTLS